MLLRIATIATNVRLVKRFRDPSRARIQKIARVEEGHEEYRTIHTADTKVVATMAAQEQSMSKAIWRAQRC